MKRIVFCFLVALSISQPLRAQTFTIADIIVDGWQRISPGIIYGLLPVGIGDEVDSISSAQIIRALSASEYFDEIEVAREGNILIITVVERPSVAEITIEGNSVLETEDIIENMGTADIAEGQIFTRAALEIIRGGIQDVYSSRGRYGATVEVEVEDLPRNRVAIKLDINEGEESRIRHINIVGNEAFEEDQLLSLFELGTKPWYMIMSRKDRYSREQFTGDLERLESFYLDNGYVEFAVESTPIAITPNQEEVYITINVIEGELYEINEVELAGDLVDAEALLRAALFVRSGQTFSQSLVTGTEEIMVQFLGNLGYAFAEATGVPEVNDDGTVDVTFFIEPGNRTYVNRVNFSGNLATADDVLRREMRQLESAPASNLQIEQSRSRLLQLGYFESVEVETEEIPGSEDQIDVNYEVLEQSFGAVSFQVGTAGSGNFFISSSLQAQNFLGTGQTVGIGVNKSRFQTSYQLQYVDPYYTPDGVSRGFNLFYRDQDSPFNVSDFNTTSFGSSFSYSYPISEIERIGFDLGYTHTELSAGFGSVQEIVSSPTFFPEVDSYVISPANANAFNGDVVDAVLGSVFDLTPDQTLMNPDPGFVDIHGDTFDNFTITGNWFRNTLNRGQMATAGAFQSLGLEVTLPGSDLEYFRLNYSSQSYWPLTQDQQWVIALKTNLGYGDGYGDTQGMPFFNNFFAGGLQSAGAMRGFEENSLGPMSTPGARYLTQTGVTLQKDEDGNILRREDGSAVGFNRDFAYETTTGVDENGTPIIDADGNPDIRLAVQNFFLDRDFDSFGGNILATASLELLFPLPFLPADYRNQVRSAFFLDVGNVFSSNCTERQKLLQNCSNLDFGELRASAGVGITYLSPFGPLTFYLAKPFGKDGDDTKSFDFTVGSGF